MIQEHEADRVLLEHKLMGISLGISLGISQLNEECVMGLYQASSSVNKPTVIYLPDAVQLTWAGPGLKFVSGIQIMVGLVSHVVDFVSM